MGAKTVISGEDQKRIVNWVGARVGEDNFGDVKAIGLEQDGELIAGVVYNMYTGSAVCMHVAAEPGKRWATPEYLFACFAYPFITLKCNRVTGLVKVSNQAARKFDEHLGFVHEGVLRKAAADGSDIIVYGMLKEECRFLKLGEKEEK